MLLSSSDDALKQLTEMLKHRNVEATRLERIRSYYRGWQENPAVPSGVSADVRKLAQISRVNVCGIVVASVTQALYVDGYRQPKESEEAKPWQVWQANGMDRKQIGVHRAGLEYGASYLMVLPGDFRADNMPVIRGFSPRNLTVLYEDMDDWPVLALRRDEIVGGLRYRLYDEQRVYTFMAESDAEEAKVTFLGEEDHNVGVCPVVRFDNEVDLDEDNPGEIEPLMSLQDQIDVITFNLLVAQHFGAFRQRYILGWVAQSEKELLKASASRVWTFEDNEVKVGDFAQTDLKGYLDSRQASLKHAATLSQTPVHELIGELVNLSAEALVAAEAGHRRRVWERQTSFGESWEEALALAGDLAGFPVDAQAEARWRDTEPRSWAATIDGLGKLVTMLGVPPNMLWERVPGVTQQDVQRWQEEAAKSGALDELAAALTGAETEGPPEEGAVA